MSGCKACGRDISDSQARRYDGYCSGCHSRIWEEMFLGVHAGRQISKMPLLWFFSEDRKRRAKKKKKD